jgi:hypothetical protein
MYSKDFQQDIRDFVSTSPKITISKLAKFIDDKTDSKYVIVEKEFIRTMIEQLDSNTFYIVEINSFIKDRLMTNQDTLEKWKTYINNFNLDD